MTSCTISSGSSNNCGPLSYTPMVICFPLMYINIISHLQYQHTCLKFLMFRQLVNNRYSSQQLIPFRNIQYQVRRHFHVNFHYPHGLYSMVQYNS